MKKSTVILRTAVSAAVLFFITGCMSTGPSYQPLPTPNRLTSIEEIEAAQRQKEEERRRQHEEELAAILGKDGETAPQTTQNQQTEKDPSVPDSTSSQTVATTPVTPAAQEQKPVQETAATPVEVAVEEEPYKPSAEDLASYSEKIVTSIALGSKSGFAAGWAASTTISNQTYAAQVKPVIVENGGKDGVSAAASFRFKMLGTETSSLTKTVDAATGGVISFSVKTDIHGPFDGYLEFYIDGKLQDKYTGVNTDWSDHMYELSKGSHQLEWRSAGASDSYTVGITNSVLLGDVKFLKLTFPETMSETFETGDFSSFNWLVGGTSTSITSDEIFQEWAAAGSWGLSSADSHGSVAKLAIYVDDNRRGTSSLELFKVNPKKASAISFDYKMQLPVTDDVYFSILMDGNEILRIRPEGSYITAWKNVSVKIPAGVHAIKFQAVSESGIMGVGIKNAVYLDNITLVPDETEYVSIYPKGLQETVANGDSLKFTAEAHRKDGSVRDGRNVTWSVNSSNAVITKDGTFTAKKAGTYTVTATIDGKKVSNSKVTVYDTDYIAKTYTYNNTSFGTIKNVTGQRHDTGTVSFNSNTPAGSSFDAAGFFALSGKVDNSGCYNYAYVSVARTDKPEETSWYMLKDTFNQRIWLRFGKGKYTVTVYDLAKIDAAKGKNGPEDIKTWTITTAKSMTFTVNNTADLKGTASADGRWLMPSYMCQSDDFRVSNIANAILAEVGTKATDVQKLVAIHDWMIHYLTYDSYSRDNPDYRKRQDSVNALLNKTAVCEGYSNLFTALERYMGIEGRLISAPAINHAWNNTWAGGKWRLVDVTYDDPEIASVENGNQENYEYFLIQLSGVNNDHPLSAIEEETAEGAKGFF